MQKEKSTVKLWTQVHAHSSDTNYEKFNQTNIEIHCSDQKLLCFFSKDPSLLSYYCLAEFFTGTHTAAADLHTNFLPTSYWLARHVTSALITKWLPQQCAPARGKREGRMRGEGRGGGGRWWQKQVGRKSEWRERVNSHVTGSSCSVDGKREIQQPQKRDDRCGFHQTPLCCIYHEAGRPDNRSADFPAESDVMTWLSFISDEKIQ